MFFSFINDSLLLKLFREVLLVILMTIQSPQYVILIYLAIHSVLAAAVIWLKYCRYAVKHNPINQSINSVLKLPTVI